MPTTTTRRPKAEPQPATFAEIAARKMTETLTQYRGFVQRSASGEKLSADELDQVLEALAYLRLPEYCFERDVQAQRDYTASAKAIAEANAKRPANDARLAEVVARIKEAEAELQALRTEQHTLANIEPMVRVGHGQRVNELALNHPHMFLDVAEAVRLRQEAKDKANGGRPAPASSEPVTSWSIGQ